MANKRTIRRTQTPAQELRKIERLLAEEFDTLAQARRALKLESVPAKKPANKRTIRRTLTPAQEKIERLLGEEFDTLAQARRALKLESVPAKKPAKKPASKPAQKPATKPAPKTDFKFGANRKSASAKPSKKGAVTRAVKPTRAAKPTRFSATKATREEKAKYAQKIGKSAYHQRLIEWWDNHPDEDADDNPYTYHEK